MLEKPAFRSQKYALMFQDASVVQVYHQRPSYPAQIYDKLAELFDPEVDTLLDVGTGLGEIARPMAARVGRVDAVDFAERMITRAKTLPGGDNPRITWAVSHVETARLTGPYGLITAADCLHWFDLNVVMPLFSDILSSSGYLAIVGRDWQTGIRDGDIIGEFSTNRDYKPWDMVDALQRVGLFEVFGEVEAGRISWQPTIDAYLECRHSQNGLSYERMGEKQASAFDERVRERIMQQISEGTVKVVNGRVQGECIGTIVWGKPKRLE
jgi:SAM-dependent methyltransferase